jgi:hypothetical protein
MKVPERVIKGKQRFDGIRWLDFGSIVFALALACGAGYWLIDLVRPDSSASQSGVATGSAAATGLLTGPPAAGSCWLIPEIASLSDPAQLQETTCIENAAVWQVVDVSPCPAAEITAELVVDGAPSQFEFCLVQFANLNAGTAEVVEFG